MAIVKSLGIRGSTFGGGTALTGFERSLSSAWEPDSSTTSYRSVGPGFGPTMDNAGGGPVFGGAPLFTGQGGSVLLEPAGNVIGKVSIPVLRPSINQDFTVVYFLERTQSVAGTIGGVGWSNITSSSGRLHIHYNGTSLYILIGSSTVAAPYTAAYNTIFPLGTPRMVSFGRFSTTYSIGIDGVQVSSGVSSAFDASAPFMAYYLAGKLGNCYVFSEAPDYTALLDLWNSGTPRTLS